MGTTLWFHDRILERWNLCHILVVDVQSEQVEKNQFLLPQICDLYYFSQATPDLNFHILRCQGWRFPYSFLHCLTILDSLVEQCQTTISHTNFEKFSLVIITALPLIVLPELTDCIQDVNLRFAQILKFLA
jgi:hypothetical protein